MVLLVLQSGRIADQPNKAMNLTHYRMLFNARINMVAYKKHSVTGRLSRR